MQDQRETRPWSGSHASIVICLVLAVLAGCGGSGSAGSGATADVAESGATSGHVTVQGHELSYNCIGEGSPTVVFMHGLGLASLDWAATARLLSGVHSCRFDRVNSGASEYADGRRQVMDSVEEAHEFVAAAGLTPPYLLAGHSYGGLISLLYAVTYPDEVSGILLADGLLPIEAELDAQYLTPEELETLRVNNNDNREQLDAHEGLIEAGPMLADLPAVPITYMSATLRPAVPEWPAGAYESALHAFIESLPMGKLVECLSGHDIPREIPDQVVSEIEELLGE